MSKEQLIITPVSDRLANGYPDLQPELHTAIHSFMVGNNIFMNWEWEVALQCRSVVHVAFETLYYSEGSMVLIISSLVVLMKDQASKLEQHYVPVLCNSLATCEGKSTNFKRLVSSLHN